MSKSPCGRQRECRRQASFSKEAALFVGIMIAENASYWHAISRALLHLQIIFLGGRYEAHFDLSNRPPLPSDVGSASANAGFSLSARWGVEVHQPKHQRSIDRQD